MPSGFLGGLFFGDVSGDGRSDFVIGTGFSQTGPCHIPTNVYASWPPALTGFSYTGCDLPLAAGGSMNAWAFMDTPTIGTTIRTCLYLGAGPVTYAGFVGLAVSPLPPTGPGCLPWLDPMTALLWDSGITGSGAASASSPPFTIPDDPNMRNFLFSIQYVIGGGILGPAIHVGPGLLIQCGYILP